MRPHFRLRRNPNRRAELDAALFQRLPVGMCRWDPDGRLFEANPALRAILGELSSQAPLQLSSQAPLQPERLLTDPSLEDLDRLLTDPSLEEVTYAVLNGSRQTFESVAHAPDGSTRWLRIHAIPILNENGQRVIEAVVEDITATRSAVAALTETRARHRAIFDTFPIALIEANFSEVAEWMKELRAGGIVSLLAYLRFFPEDEDLAIGMIETTSVNQATIELVDAADKTELTGSFKPADITKGAREVLIQQLNAVWEHRSGLTIPLEGCTIWGHPIWGTLHWTAPTLQGAPDYKQVLLAITTTPQTKPVAPSPKEGEADTPETAEPAHPGSSTRNQIDLMAETDTTPSAHTT